MGEVIRYVVDACQSPEGQYVAYHDYATLEDERNALAAEVKQAYEDGRISACNAGKPGCPRVKELEAEVAKLRAACAAKDAAIRELDNRYNTGDSWSPVAEVALSDTAGTNWIDATGAVETMALPEVADGNAWIDDTPLPAAWVGKSVLILVKP